MSVKFKVNVPKTIVDWNTGDKKVNWYTMGVATENDEGVINGILNGTPVGKWDGSVTLLINNDKDQGERQPVQIPAHELDRFRVLYPLWIESRGEVKKKTLVWQQAGVAFEQTDGRIVCHFNAIPIEWDGTFRLETQEPIQK